MSVHVVARGAFARLEWHVFRRGTILTAIDVFPTEEAAIAFRMQLAKTGVQSDVVVVTHHEAGE